MFSEIYYYLTATSNFEIRAPSRAGKTQIEEQGEIYFGHYETALTFGYQFYFEGYGNPTIENVYLYRRMER